MSIIDQCKRCKGAGTFPELRKGVPFARTCPRCNGSGYLPAKEKK
jgi:DnaJ-class molecular chaperone